ncbi:hypothetical protein GCM10011380_00870 [Sphingomonas metalli]|uniref:Uncharacterized protein n=1 Tax=Sphingomonas metalli TaxID=1779358 RepID=A0A916ST13_9SPHN|nr:hypothetical protein [Sphingomonas metalli]GGB15256.1 hypothetical protein GCM10011380_00870 [Sphingomonas metalli]
MDRRERIKVELAVAVLRQAIGRDEPAAVRSEAIRLALRVLWPHCRERWPLVTFWESGQQDNDIGRTQGVTAAFNAIVRQVRATGAYRG